MPQSIVWPTSCYPHPKNNVRDGDSLLGMHDLTSLACSATSHGSYMHLPQNSLSPSLSRSLYRSLSISREISQSYHDFTCFQVSLSLDLPGKMPHDLSKQKKHGRHIWKHKQKSWCCRSSICMALHSLFWKPFLPSHMDFGTDYEMRFAHPKARI